MPHTTFAGLTASTSLLGLAGLASGAWHAWRLRIAFASRTWPTVPGRIQTAELDPNTPTTRVGVFEHQLDPDDDVASISYTYQVGPRSMMGWRVRFGWGDDDESAAEDYHYYHEQRDVTVYYDPADPDRSVLEPGPVPSLWLGLAASVALVAFACWRLMAR